MVRRAAGNFREYWPLYLVGLAILTLYIGVLAAHWPPWSGGQYTSFSGRVVTVDQEGIVFSEVEGNTSQSAWDFGELNSRVQPGRVYIVRLHGGRVMDLFPWPGGAEDGHNTAP